MDIYFDDNTSLRLLRIAARNPSIRFVPSDVRSASPLAVPSARLGNLGIPELLGMLRVPEAHRLGILIPDAKSRVRSSMIDCHVRKSLRGSHPLYRLECLDDSGRESLVQRGTNVYVLSPPNIVLGMAMRLQRQVTDGKMSRSHAVLMIEKLCLELCGTYSHDPFDPWSGDVAYKTQPVMTCSQLRSDLAPAGREQGIALAREAAAFVYDLSGSPQESFLGPALFEKNSKGGLALGDFVANEPLDLGPRQRAAIICKQITPDFHMKAYRTVIEFLGLIHFQGDNPRKDHVRSLDYQTLGLREFDFFYEDVNTQEAFLTSAQRIVAAIEQYVGSGPMAKFKRLCADEDFLKLQYDLFTVFRPWLR